MVDAKKDICDSEEFSKFVNSNSGISLKFFSKKAQHKLLLCQAKQFWIQI